MAKAVWTSEQILTQFLRDDESWPVSTIFYSFFATRPASATGDAERSGFVQLTAEQQNFVRLAFDMVSDVTNLRFVQTADDGDARGGISFAQSTTIADYAWGFTYSSTRYNGDIVGAEIWLSTDAVQQRSWFAGGYNFMALMHEVLHAIGLPHPGNYNADGRTITYAADAVYFQDSRQYSVLSYFAASETGANYAMGDGLYSASTLLRDDIQALQALYGVNTATRAGDTTYGFNATADVAAYNCATNTHPIWCVWDGGGVDTLDFSGYAMSQRIDLHAGAFSDTAGMTFNISIAYGASIERAIGGAGADLLTGNQLANVLIGGDGADVLHGLESADTLEGGAGNDTLYGGTAADFLNGGSGLDTASFDFAFSAASGLRNAARLSIAHGADIDILTQIEVLTFSDGRIELLDASALVDDLFYNNAFRDVYAAGIDADQHYNDYGWREGRDPDANFTTTGYLAANADVRAAGMNPLEHFRLYGFVEGRDPSANFDLEQYLAVNRDVAAAQMNPLEHYLLYGQAEGRTAYAAVGKSVVNGFDSEFYLLSYSLFSQSGADPFADYTGGGWQAGRDPNAYFDVSWYLQQNSDVAAAGMDPLTHYWQYGWKEGRDPSSDFDTSDYLASNADVAAAGMNPLAHYLAYGRLEGRDIHDAGWLM